MSTVRILDYETHNIPWYGQVASPHNPDNYIVMAAWRDDVFGGLPGEIQFHHFLNKEDANAFPLNFDGVDFVVAHNAMYEISWFLSRHREEFLKFLNRGGRVLCTQQAQYILSNFTETYPALGEIATQYGGTPKVDGVKILWEQGILTADIDPDLLKEYLIGPSGDIDNTARVFYGQLELLVARGQWRLFLERCEALLAFACCEFAGLKVDTAVAEKNLAEQEAELAELRIEANKLLPELPPELEFNWGSDYHMSALLFGGPVKYQHRVPRTDTEGNLIFEKADNYLLGDRYVPVDYLDAQAPEVVEMLIHEYGNLDRYKAGKNKNQPKIHKCDTTTPQTKLADTSYTFSPLIDINLLPPHIKDNFKFTPEGRRNGEWVSKRMLCDGVTPVFSTSSEVLDVLGKHGFDSAKLLVRAAQLDKDNSTYYRSIEYNKDGSVKKVKGMLQYVQPDGIIHHNLNMTATSTGRLSSSNPNL